jgi:type II secretory pathway component GspD/PulD (secretin)/prefoldin subunit 5
MIKKRLIQPLLLVGLFIIPALMSFQLIGQDKEENIENTPKINEEVGKEIIYREANEALADELVKQANEAYSKSEFDKAVEKYIETKTVLAKMGDSSYVKNKIEKCDKAISSCYYYWSQKLAKQAEDKVKAKEYDEAMKLCRKAIEIYPPSKEKMQELIERYEKMQKVVQYRSDVSERETDPKKESRLYNIDVLARQGVVLYKDNQLDAARDKFEEILMINPYDMNAIDYIRKINIKMTETGKLRYNTTTKERKSEVEWKMVTPLIPRTLSGESESTLEPIKRDSETSKIQEKLKNIIIKKIEFEEVTIPTVVKYLKERSKQIDKEGVGVNIFLRLSAPKKEGEEGAKGVAEEPAADDEFADDDTAADDAAEDDTAEDDTAGDDEFAEEGDETTTTPEAYVPTVTMVVDDIPLGDAIRYICRAANLRYRIEKYAIIIASPDVALDDVETRIYPLESEALDSIGGGDDTEAVKNHFARRGISFPAGAKIVYDGRISRLIATNTPDNLNKIEEIIRELNVVDPQVLIQSKFVEIQQNDLEELGFEYLVSRTSDHGITWAQNDNIMRNVKDNGLGSNVAAGSRPDEIFNYTVNKTNGINANIVVHALDQADSINVLSTPRITTMNGQEATIRMITEVYYPESWGESEIGQSSSDGGDTTSVFVGSIPEFGDPTDEGIVLRVTPNVDADHYTITLQMNPVVQQRVGWTDYTYTVQVSSVTGGVTTVATYTNPIIMPVIEARTVDTQVTVYDGETLILGGIIRDQTDSFDDQIPILGDIPLVGRLFQSKAQYSRKINLLMFLTCRLINPDGSPIRERELRGLPSFRQ